MKWKVKYYKAKGIRNKRKSLLSSDPIARCNRLNGNFIYNLFDLYVATDGLEI